MCHSSWFFDRSTTFGTRPDSEMLQLKRPRKRYLIIIIETGSVEFERLRGGIYQNKYT